jgi:glucose-1-phosphate adenylyltransferase
MREWCLRGGDVVVLVLGGGRGTRLEPLTLERSKPAVPMAGKYRLIDIPLSNAINSGMERIFVLTQFNSVSLHRHIGTTYRFDAFSRGYVQILAAQQTPRQESWFLGTADAVRRNLHIVREARGDSVLILAGDHIYRMDYRELVREHKQTGADVTVGVLPCSEEEIADFGAVRVDDAGRIIEFREKPKTAEARAGMEVAPELLRERGVSTSRPYIASMGIYLFSKPVLLEALRNDLKDFGRDVIPACVDRFQVQASFFKGYWRDIGTIGAFFDAHMDLTSTAPPFDFYDPNWPFYTHPRYLPAAHLTGCQLDGAVIAEGTIADGATIEQSVIGVRTVLRHCTVRRTLIMGADYYDEPSRAEVVPLGIGEGSVIENAIVDKNARIGRDCVITNEKGLREADGEGWGIRDGIVVIPRRAVIPAGTVI